MENIQTQNQEDKSANTANIEKETLKTSKTRTKIIAIVACCIVASAALVCWLVLYLFPHNQAIEIYNESVSALNERNAELDTAIESLQSVINSDEEPLDSNLTMIASETIGQAQGTKQEAPSMPNDTEDILACAEEIDVLGNYQSSLESLNTAQQNLETSIAQMKLVTNPSEQYVIERLQGIPNITGSEAVTENNDPNGKLNKAGGYTATVFFTSDLVDQGDVSGNTIIEKGTEGGGSIEVYANQEDAEKRKTYLSAFDGSILSNGSHNVYGTVLIRISDKLTASQQEELTKRILDSLTRL